MGNLDARLLRFRNDPGSEPAVGLAAALIDANREREATEVAEAGLARTPKDPELGLLLGRGLVASGDMLRAQQAFLQAARVAPRDPRPFRWLGEVLLRRGDPGRAKKVLAKARALGGGDDPAIRKLLERATRFERIADEADSEVTKVAGRGVRPAPAPPKPVAPPARVAPPPPVAAPPPPVAAAPPPPPKPMSAPPPKPAAALYRGFDDDDDDESTVVASELSLQLAEAARREEELVDEPAVDEDLATHMMDRDQLGLADALKAKPSPPPLGAPSPFADPPLVEDDPPTQERAIPRATPIPAVSEPGPPPHAVIEPDSDDLPMQWDEAEPPPERPDDMTLGANAGQGEDVDAVLGMLREQKLFEEPDGEPRAWASASASKPVQTKTLGFHIAVWVLGVGVVAGAWFGYQYWIGQQEAEAAQLAAGAAEDALRGDHENLIDAERNLRKARELHPLQQEGPNTLLFVHAQRALEDGSFQPGYLRPSLDLADRVGVDGPRVKATRAVLLYAEGDTEAGEEALSAAREAAADDAASLYLIGRLEQRLGDERALEHLQRAIEESPGLAAAHLALAEDASEGGRAEEADEHIGRVLEQYEGHLRASLWQQYFAADDGDPDGILATLGPLEERLEKGAPTDEVLFHLTRARLLRRKGDLQPAEDAVESAARAGATEPRLQALVASAAFALGELPRAQQAATAAVSSAPAIPEYRKLLAEIMVARRDGVGALRVLSPLSSEDPDVLRASARAALLVGSEESLSATVEALQGFVEGAEEPSVEMQALLLRARAQTGTSRGMLREAKGLVQDAPGDPDAALALAEVALAEGANSDALEALESVTSAAPRDPDGHYLMGRAKRIAGDAEEAEASFREALELSPSFNDARIELGYLLLDSGKYEEAEENYQALARTGQGRSMAVVARLGRVEALIGLGRVDDATVQFDGLRDAEKELASAQLVAGRLALAKKEPGDAVRALRPLAEGEGATTDVRALYGEALRQAGSGQAAAEIFSSVIETDEGHPEALLGFAEVLLRGDKAREAADHIRTALQSLERRIRPPSVRARALVLKGRVALEQDDENGATESLRAAVDIAGAPPEAHFYLGEALSGRNAPEAREAYERYLELDPEGSLASRARRALR